MSLWILLSTLIGATCAALAVALVRRREGVRRPQLDDEGLRLQLGEIEAQASAGAMSRDTADGLRTETIRRYLASDAGGTAAGKGLSRRAQSVLAVGLAAALALAAALLYGKLGRPGVPAAARAALTGAPSSPAASLSLPQITAKLEARVRQAPQDVKALQYLAWAYAQAGRNAEAAGAYGRAASLPGADPQDWSSQGEALTQAANGIVTAPALAAFRTALVHDPADPRARYFIGAYKEEQGDHAGSMSDWIALLKSAPPGAPWAPRVRALIEQEAAQRGEDVSRRLPPAAPPAAGGAAAPDPNAMVARLAQRLAAQPHDLDGWLLMLRARMVLGQNDQAVVALRSARAAFAGDAAAQARLTAAARELKVPGA